MSKITQIEYPGWDKKTKPAYTKLKDLIDFKALDNNLAKLGAEIILKHAEKIALQKMGIVNAYPHMKNDKYLFLMHPQVDGERKKEYIGAKKVQQTAALKAIERYKIWVKVCEELENLERRCHTISRQYQILLDNLDPESTMSGWHGY